MFVRSIYLVDIEFLAEEIGEDFFGIDIFGNTDHRMDVGVFFFGWSVFEEATSVEVAVGEEGFHK